MQAFLPLARVRSRGTPPHPGLECGYTECGKVHGSNVIEDHDLDSQSSCSAPARTCWHLPLKVRNGALHLQASVPSSTCTWTALAYRRQFLLVQSLSSLLVSQASASAPQRECAAASRPPSLAVRTIASVISPCMLEEVCLTS